MPRNEIVLNQLLNEIQNNVGTITTVDTNGNQQEELAYYLTQPRLLAMLMTLQRLEEIKKQQRRNYATEELGKFFGIYANIGEILEQPLLPQDLFRLIKIASYLNYQIKENKNLNLLYKTERTILSKNELNQLCGLSKSTWARTKETLENQQYILYDNDLVLINDTFARKGNLKRKSDSNINRRFYKISKEGINSIYNSINISEHRIIGRIFKLLSFVNSENVFVMNPIFYKSELDEAENPLTEKAFVSLTSPKNINIDNSNVNKFMNKLYSYKFQTSKMGHPQPIIKLAYYEPFGREVIFINPYLVGLQYRENAHIIKSIFNC